MNETALWIGGGMIVLGTLSWILDRWFTRKKAAEDAGVADIGGVLRAAKDLSVPQLLIVFGFVLVLLGFGFVTGELSLADTTTTTTAAS